MRPNAVDVTIGEDQYQIGKMSALGASWVILKVINKIKELLGNPDRITSGDVTKAVESLDVDTFEQVQQRVLMACKKHVMIGDVPSVVPIMTSPGVWDVQFCSSLANEPGLVWSLTLESLMFNLDRFFPEAASS